MSGVYRGLTSTLKPCQLQGPWILNTMLNSERWPGVCMNHPKIKHKLSNHKMSAVSGWGQGELGLNPLRDPAAYPDQGEAVGAWLGVWHLWVDAHPQEALRLGCLPPVWASWVHQPHRDLQCAPSAWNNITLNRSPAGTLGWRRYTKWYNKERRSEERISIWKIEDGWNCNN